MESVNVKLREAAENGDAAELKILLTHPLIDLLSTDRGGQTALMHAASKGHIDCTRILLPGGGAFATSRGG